MQQQKWDLDIPKADYSKADEALRKYYADIDKIDLSRETLRNLHIKLEKLKENKKTYKSIFIDPELNMAVGFEERVQTSPNGTSYAEREFIKQEERLDRNIIDTAGEISNLEIEIENTETNIGKMKKIINDFGEEYKDILKYRYGYQSRWKKYSLDEIGEILHMAKSTVKDKLEKVIKVINKILI